MIKVCHVTSVHPKEDIRIFRKECLSLAEAGYDVSLVEQGESEEKDGVHIIGFGAIPESRIKRILFGAKKAYRKALEADADVYHLHDPELLHYAKKLKKRGKKVIFDSHEDVPADILEKYWIPSFLRKMMSKSYSKFEARTVAKIDGVISVTPHICDRFKKANANTAMVTNYPIIENSLVQPDFNSQRIVFPGLMSDIWSIDSIISAIEPIEGAVLEIRSGGSDGDYLDKLRALPGWEKVNYGGRVSHAEVMKLMSECCCGMALLKYYPNSGWHRGTLGNTKIFEYMMAGLPVIFSDSELWHDINEKWHVGICVDPENIPQITEAVKKVFSDPDAAREMGINGREAVQKEYNWSLAKEVLLHFYRKTLSDKGNVGKDDREQNKGVSNSTDLQ